MKKFSNNKNKSRYKVELHADDLRILQKKLSGTNVYSSVQRVYKRLPKHRKHYAIYY